MHLTDTVFLLSLYKFCPFTYHLFHVPVAYDHHHRLHMVTVHVAIAANVLKAVLTGNTISTNCPTQ